MSDALENLPARHPRGSTENMIRAFMMPLLLGDFSREEAERIAIAVVEDWGLDVSNLDLQYKPGA